jgi:hypothetical protein
MDARLIKPALIIRAAGLMSGIGILALILAWVSNKFLSAEGWWVFVAVLLIGFLILLSGFEIVKKDSPVNIHNWLGRMLLAAVILRLIIGGLWFTALPGWGYGSPVEAAGYIMSDAYARDSAAWELAASERSLSAAFTEYQKVDQYGGLLF